ncbi:hypothetical protein ACFE04_031935 [Oxalis oulophora]
MGFFTIVGFLLLSLCTFTTCVPNTNIQAVLCNSGVYSQGDPFRISLNYILDDLVVSTVKVEGYEYRNISPYPNAFAYGHGACNSSLTGEDCGACLSAAKTALFGSCPNRIGARSVLNDCTIRFVDDADFDRYVLVAISDLFCYDYWEDYQSQSGC